MNASPGDMVTFHAGEDAPSGLMVHWGFFYKTGEAEDPFPVWLSARSYEKPTIGMYQMSALKPGRFTVSKFRPINIPARSCVVESPLLSLRAEEVGQYNSPPFATIVIRVDENISEI